MQRTKVSRRRFLQGAGAGLALASGLQGRTARAAAPARPNVVLIITDDGGYGDIGSYGAPDIRTPNIDSIGREGVRLTDFYANAPSCSPTRAGLISGRYQQRYAIEAPLQGPGVAPEQGLPVAGRSLPQLLKNNGYTTGLLGKWHLGYKPEYSPNAHGFDYFFGFKSGFIDYYEHTDGEGHPDLFENDTAVTQTGYMTDVITERSLKFIGDNAARPFFLQMSYNAPHWPYQVPGKPSVAIDNARHLQPGEQSAGTRADYAAMLERVDQGVGQILALLKQRGIDRNTIVIFTNDNGGEWLSRNAPLFNRKQSVWEGGIRVPMLIRWPAGLPAGRTSAQVGITMDLTASILAATGTPVPAGAAMEGINLLPILAGEAPVVERTLFWRTVLAPVQRAVRSGDWKLVFDGGSLLLFNLKNDLGERNDLTNQNQAEVARLKGLTTAWEKEVDAEAVANGTNAFNRRRPTTTIPATPANAPQG